jgi:uncharacterized tellurite resistance protein B-like protein
MFESLKHWLNNLDKEISLFEHSESEVLHVAIASLLYHIISADGQERTCEKKMFSTIMAKEFLLSEKQITQLYDYVKTLNSELTSDLNTVNAYLKANPNLRMAFMKKLNQLICVDEVENEELTIFYQTMKTVFPDVAKHLCD